MTDNTYEDLTPYSHRVAPYVFAEVKNVGWVSITSARSSFAAHDGIVQKLRLAASGVDGFRPLVEPIRESPQCHVCGALSLTDGKGNSLLKSEIWIPSGDLIYASPIEIIHYIEWHGYLPPKEYTDAVLRLDLTDQFDAEKVYRNCLVSSGWFNRKR